MRWLMSETGPGVGLVRSLAVRRDTCICVWTREFGKLFLRLMVEGVDFLHGAQRVEEWCVVANPVDKRVLLWAVEGGAGLYLAGNYSPPTPNRVFLLLSHIFSHQNAPLLLAWWHLRTSSRIT